MGIYANSSFTPAVKINQPIIPSGTLSIGGTGFYNVYSYSLIDVNIEDLLEKKLTSTLNLSLNNYTDLSASKINCAAFASCNLSNIYMPNVTEIKSSAFLSCSGLISINFPKCTYIGREAFSSCKDLTTVELPSLLRLTGQSAFKSCLKLTSVSLPKCTYISANAFDHCSNLTTVYCPSVSYIGGDAFWFCSYLTSFPMPLVTELGNYVFEYCYRLESAYLPILSRSIPYECFWKCSALSNVYAPLTSQIGESAFDSCLILPSISLPKVTRINTAAFKSCYNLLSVYLNVSTVPSLSNINAFNSTPIAGYTTSTGGVYGSIFVPTSLYSSFISATN